MKRYEDFEEQRLEDVPSVRFDLLIRKEFTIGLDPQMKGLAIGNSEPIRKAQIRLRLSDRIFDLIRLSKVSECF